MRQPGGGRPILWAYLVFLVGSAVSIAFASPPTASFFFTWQLARAVLVFVAVSKVAANPQGMRWIVGGLALGIVYQAGFSIWQRLSGVVQASGTMGNQNLLGMATEFALLLCTAAILAGNRRPLIKIGVAAAMIAVTLTGSRATTGLAAAGLVSLLLVSLVRRTSALKMRVVMLGGVVMLVAAPIAVGTLHTRFGSGAITDSNNSEREAFERAAKAMWSDHPMGVGANQYVVVANTAGYSERAGVIWNWGSRAANVHNTYLLLGAETGWLGFLSFLLLLTVAMIVSARTAWARPRDESGEYALGALFACVTVAIHCLYEWIFVTWVIQYLFAITLGIIAGAARQQRVPARLKKRAAASRLLIGNLQTAAPGGYPDRTARLGEGRHAAP